MQSVATGTATRGGHRLTAALRITFVILWAFMASMVPLLSSPTPVRGSTVLLEDNFSSGCSLGGSWLTEGATCSSGAYAPGNTVTGTLFGGISAGDSILLEGEGRSRHSGLAVSFSIGWYDSLGTFLSATTVHASSSTNYSTFQPTVIAPANTAAWQMRATTAMYINWLRVTNQSSGGGGPTPTPAPTPTPTPTPSGGPSPTPDPSGSPPPYVPPTDWGSGGARLAAQADVLTNWAQSRCRGSTMANLQDEQGYDVVSCHSWSGNVEASHQYSEQGHNGFSLAKTWFLGMVEQAQRIHIVGYSRPGANTLQTWCAPNNTNTDCLNNVSGLGSHRDLQTGWNQTVTGYTGGNLPLYRYRGRTTMTAFVWDNDGVRQASAQCIPWPLHGPSFSVMKNTERFHERDAYTCDFGQPVDGILLMRSRVFGHEARYNEPYPNPDRLYQHYAMWFAYAVLADQGRFTDRSVGKNWHSCQDDDWTELPIYPCVPDIPGVWFEDGQPEDIPPTPGGDVPGAPEPGIGWYPDQDPTQSACPVSGEPKPGCVPLPNCGVLDAFCHVQWLGLAISNTLTDLFMPGPRWDPFEPVFTVAETRVPFGWFAQVANTVDSSMGASAGALSSFTLTVGTASVSIGNAIQTALDHVAPHRGLIFAGILIIMILGVMRWLMAAVGVSPAHAPSDSGGGS